MLYNYKKYTYTCIKNDVNLLLYIFGFPKGRVLFMKQAIIQFWMGNCQVEDIVHFNCVTAANIFDQFRR